MLTNLYLCRPAKGKLLLSVEAFELLSGVPKRDWPNDNPAQKSWAMTRVSQESPGTEPIWNLALPLLTLSVFLLAALSAFYILGSEVKRGELL